MNILKKLNKPLTRRQTLVSLATLFGVPLGVSVYGFGIEPKSPVVKSVNIRLPYFPGTLRAVQLSDIHIHNINPFMVRVAELANSFDPDYIFLTGDLVEDHNELPACLEWITSLQCKFRICFVPGNWEHFSETLLKYDLVRKLRSVGVHTLYNDGEVIEWHAGKFYLAGIDDAYYGSPEPARAFMRKPDRVCSILLSHSPLGVYLPDSLRADLVLSGHTHGGQVRIPGLGAITTPPGSGKFEQGLYKVGKSQLYVNRGIGTSILPVRFMCPPEVTYLTITG